MHWRGTIIWILALLLMAGCDDSGTNDEALGKGPKQFSTATLFSDPDSSTNTLTAGPGSDRENWQKPHIVISRLGDLSDKVVADIGAGTGYFSMRLARKAQKVIAVDINQGSLDYINRRLSRTRASEMLNIETRLTEPDEPSLSVGEADLVLLVNTYSFIENRVDYFAKVREGLSPAGRLVVVDFKAEPMPVGPPVEEKLSLSLVKMELDSAGFDVVTIDSASLDYQFIFTAQKR